MEHASDADDETSSQTSTSPGITLTPDVKQGPFKYPRKPTPKMSGSETAKSGVPMSKLEKENDDGFFSGFDLDECLTEDMDTFNS